METKEVNISNGNLPYPAFGTELPLGDDSLQTLRLAGGIYVDKTDKILELTRFRKVFLSRPRRFGKTLLVSTLETLFKDGLKYFQGSRRLYRNGAYIEEPFKIAGHWQNPTYPVVRLDFSFLRDCYNSALEHTFKARIVRAFRKAGFSLPVEAEADWLGVLQDWLVSLDPYSVVLLIDEYDAGLGSRLNDPDGFSRVLSMLSMFFTMVKGANRVWRFVLITGVARFGKASIFSGMNDVKDISFLPKFGTLLGYTEDEIKENFAPFLRLAALENNTDEKNLLEGMREHYDGFCFDDKASTHVYAPWSVLNFLADCRCEFSNYWSDSGGQSSVLLSYMKSDRSDFLSLRTPYLMAMDTLMHSTDFEHISDEFILAQAGYLTLVRVSGPMALLDFPNIEVRDTFNEINLLHAFGKAQLPDFDAYDSSHALLTGNIEEWLKILNALLLSVPYDGGNPIHSEAVLRAVMYAHVSKKGIYCRPEVHGAHGRSDLEISAGKFHWVVELKYVRDRNDKGKKRDDAQKLSDDALKAAVKQIQDKKYGLATIGRTLIRVAFVFSEFQRKIVAWAHVPSGEGAVALDKRA